jgi:AraC family transcriptional regulator
MSSCLDFQVAACRCDHFKISEPKRQFNGAENRHFYCLWGLQFPHTRTANAANVSSIVKSNGDLVRDLTGAFRHARRTFGTRGKAMPMSIEGFSDIGISPSGVCSPHRSIVEISPPGIVCRRLAHWGRIQADTVNVTRRGTYDYSFQARRHLLIAHERAERHEGETFIEGLPTSTSREFNCRLSFVPAGRRFHGWERPRVLTRVTYFYIDLHDRLLDPEIGVAFARISPRLFFFDQAVWDTALKLKAEVGNSDPSSRQYVEALSLVLMHELIRAERTVAGAAAPPLRGGLPRWQQKRVAEFIEEHLAEDIPLATLAELADLSLYHFARAFRLSFGVPPHRYHIARRMERAKNLLEGSALSVTQIGIQIGFRDTSSFTRAYRRFAGIAPSEYRRCREAKQSIV